MKDRRRLVLGVAVVLWATPRPALAHSGPCTPSDSFTTVGIGTFVGLLLFRPWRKSTMNATARVSRWILPALLASVVTVGACAPKTAPAAKRPPTDARLEITQPTPNENLAPTFTLTLNLTGATIVPAENVSRAVRGDQGHIHVLLDGKLISMTYGTSQEMKDVPPGPHNLQAEFVATDHAPFANRVIVAVAFNVSAQGSPS
jgi:hypothetical protein